MADHALGSTGKVPGLLTPAVCSGFILDGKRLIETSGILQQNRIRLFVVPNIRIATPVLIPVGFTSGYPFLVQIFLELLEGEQDQNDVLAAGT